MRAILRLAIFAMVVVASGYGVLCKNLEAAKYEAVLNTLLRLNIKHRHSTKFLKENQEVIIQATEYLLQTENSAEIIRVKNQLNSLLKKHPIQLVRVPLILFYAIETPLNMYFNDEFNLSLCDLTVKNLKLFIDNSGSTNDFQFCPNESVLVRSEDSLVSFELRLKLLRNVPNFIHGFSKKFRLYVEQDEGSILIKKNDRNELILKYSDIIPMYYIKVPDIVCDMKIVKIFLVQELIFPVCPQESLLRKSLKFVSVNSIDSILDESLYFAPIVQIMPSSTTEESVLYPFWKKKSLNEIIKANFDFADKISMKDRYLIHNGILHEMIVNKLSSIIFAKYNHYFHMYFDEYDRFQREFDSEEYFQQLILARYLISVGTPNENEETSLQKHLITTSWYSSHYGEEGSSARILNALQEVLKDPANIYDLAMESMISIPLDFSSKSNAIPQRITFNIKVPLILLSSFFQTYFLSYLQDPRKGDAFQGRVMELIYNEIEKHPDFIQACSLHQLNNEDKEKERSYIKNSFKNGKTWYFEKNGRPTIAPIIQVKSAFHVKKHLIVADSKALRSLDLWRFGSS